MWTSCPRRASRSATSLTARALPSRRLQLIMAKAIRMLF